MKIISKLKSKNCVCPCCEGKGGYRDIILFDGIGGGPYYECVYCHDDLYVNFFRWFSYKYTDWKYIPHNLIVWIKCKLIILGYYYKRNKYKKI